MKVKNVTKWKKLIDDYLAGMGIYDVCEKDHVGKLKVKKILSDNNIELRKRGGQSLHKSYIIDDWRIEKYLPMHGHDYIAKAKDGSYETNDYMNNGGYLTSYIRKTYNVGIPTLYDRKEYHKLTGNYWWDCGLFKYVWKNNKIG